MTNHGVTGTVFLTLQTIDLQKKVEGVFNLFDISNMTREDYKYIKLNKIWTIY